MKLNRNPIRVVFFDATGTLFDVRGSVGAIYREIARLHGVESAAEELDASFRAAFRSKTDEAFPPHGRSGLEAEKEWWRDVVWRVFRGRMDKSAFQDYFEDVFDIFRRSEAWVVFDDTLGSLDRLRKSCYRLAVISNFDSRLLKVLANLGLEDRFEQVHLSWQVGAAKPDEELFRHALMRMGVSSSEALHVGDSIEEDLVGALSAGLQAVLLDRNDRHPSWNRSPRIHSLAELVALLCP